MSYTITGGKTNFVSKPALDHDGKNFLLKAPFGGSKDALKQAVQVTWDPKRKLWVLPDLVLYANSALELYPDLPLTAQANARLTRETPTSFSDDSDGRPIQPQLIFDVWKKLYPFQQEAVARLIDPTAKRNQQVVLSPGLGKTIVAMLAARMLGAKSVLVVCIKDLMRQWQDEEGKWFGERTLRRLHGEAPPWSKHGWAVANYDTVVGRLHQTFEDHHWNVVIVDESVLIKNRKTRRFKRLLDLRYKDVDRVWELSGSPSTRYPDDLYTQMRLLYPDDFRSYWRFAGRFCTTEQNPWSAGQMITGTRLDRDTKEDLRDLQFVRNQKDVLADLPEEIPVLVPIELGAAQRKAYNEMSSKFITELESGKKIKASIVLSKLIRLQQITSNLINIAGPSDEPKKGTKYVDPNDVSAKADALIDMLEAGSIAYPAIVWVNWVPGAKALIDRIRAQRPELRSAWVHGAESKRDEKNNEENFLNYKAGELDILVLGIPVGRFGHNLQVTRTAIYFDKVWDADAWVQSMKRVKRIGLDHRPVVVTLKAVNTTDEMIEENLAGKLPSISSISNDDLASMLRSLTGEE